MPLASPSATHRAADRPSNRTGLAVAALIVGVLAAALALAVAFVGVLLPYAWYAVVGLAVLTLACGLLSVGRKHHASSAGGIVAWVGVVGGVVALVLGVWGMTNVLRPHLTTTAGTPPPVQVLHPSADQPARPPAPPTTSALGGPELAIGQAYAVNNVTVRIAGPDNYQATGMVQTSDGSTVTRVVKFTATITNSTGAALLANSVDIEGIVGGTTVGHVYDEAIHGLNQDIQPGQTVTFPVAFNVPPTPTPIVVEVKPQSMSSTDKVFYQGTV